MTNLILKQVLLTGILYLIWKVFISYKNSAFLGRIFLLYAAFMPFISNYIHLKTPFVHNSVVNLTLHKIVIYSDKAISQSYGNILFYIYLIMSLLMILRILVSFIKIIKLKHNAQNRYKKGNIKIFETEEINIPFSFGTMIFLPKDLDNKTKNIVIEHEYEHIKRLNYIDLWAMNILLIFKWYNPFLWIILRELKFIHELSVDRAILKNVSITDYLQTISLFHGLTPIANINTLNSNKLKKRFQLMIQTPKHTAMRLLFTIIALFLSTTLSIASSGTREITYGRDTTLPVFPGGNEALRNFIAKNLVYPKEALNNNWQDIVIVKFTVNENGEVENPSIVKGQYDVLNREALKVISKLPKFKPAYVNSKPVSVSMKLPIVFRLKSDGKNKS